MKKLQNLLFTEVSIKTYCSSVQLLYATLHLHLALRDGPVIAHSNSEKTWSDTLYNNIYVIS